MANERYTADLHLDLSGFEQQVRRADGLGRALSNSFKLAGQSFGLGFQGTGVGKLIPTEIRNASRGVSETAKAAGLLYASAFIYSVGKQFRAGTMKKLQQNLFSNLYGGIHFVSPNIMGAYQNLLNKINKPPLNTGIFDFSKFDLLKHLRGFSLDIQFRTLNSLVALITKLGYSGNVPLMVLGEGLNGLASAALSAGPAVAGIGLAIGLLASTTIAAVPAMAALQATALRMADPFLRAAASIDSLQRGIRATSSEAGTLIPEIEKLAKLPGISRADAYRSVTSLVAAGLSENQALAMTAALGNAVASTGGGRGQFEGAVTAFSQIAGKDTLSAEEIRQQLGDRIPGLSKMLRDEFGVSQANDINKLGTHPLEFLLRLTDRFNKTFQGGGSSKQSVLDNYADSVERLKASFGEGLAKTALPLMEKLSNTFDKLSAEGKLDRLGEKLGKIFEAKSIEKMIDLAVEFTDTIGEAASTINDVMYGLTTVGEKLLNTFKGVADKLKGVGINIWSMMGGLPGAIGAYANWIDSKIHNRKTENANTGIDDSTWRKLLADQAEALRANPLELTFDKEAENTRYLREIANNTKPMKIERMVLGGGNIGAKGVALTDLTIRGPQKDKRILDAMQVIYEEIVRARQTLNGPSRRAGY